MKRPDNYSFYSNRKKNKIPFRDWPNECKQYAYWLRDIRIHPEWKNLTDNEYYQAKLDSKKQRGINAAKLMRERFQKKDENEKQRINKSKGSHYNNLSAEEKVVQNKILSQRSKNFWDSMTEDERNIFSQYRWNLKSDEEKQIIIKRFNEGSKKYQSNLSKEEIDAQIKRMNEARLKKLQEDAEFREEQFSLLRKHCREYFDNMSNEEYENFYKNIGEKRSINWTKQWNEDAEFRKKWTEFLNLHCRDYVDSLTPEERHNHAMKGGIASAAKWDNPKFREEQTQIRRDAHYKYLESLSPEDKFSMLTDNMFNRKFESHFKNSILNNKFYLQKEYPIEYDGHYKHWDYALFDKSNNQLLMLIDLDGSFYHGDSSDYNGLHSAEEVDERRGYFIPDGVKVQIIEEKKFNDGFKKMIDSLVENYDEYINNLFKEYRSISFPYPNYNHMDLIKSYFQLLKLNPDNKYLKLSIRNREGDRLITHFHHSIYHAHTKGSISPYDAWQDDDLLRKCIINRTLYRSTLDSNKILQGFNVSKIAPKVSVFSAGRAKLIIHKYLSEFNEIFDPFSGFSGRMLGAMSLDKHYIGQDISKTHVMESKRIVEFLRSCSTVLGNVIYPHISCKDILNSYSEYECLFTCPPYEDKEVWEGVICDKRSSDDWIDICLTHFKCKRYVFVVDKTVKYQEYVQDVIVNKSHFGYSYEYLVVIDR